MRAQAHSQAQPPARAKEQKASKASQVKQTQVHLDTFILEPFEEYYH